MDSFDLDGVVYTRDAGYSGRGEKFWVHTVVRNGRKPRLPRLGSTVKLFDRSTFKIVEYVALRCLQMPRSSRGYVILRKPDCA